MGESDPAGSVVTATKEVHSSSSPQGKKKPPLQTRPGRFTFVDSIKEGFRKISNYKDSAKRKEVVVQRQSEVISPERRKAGGIVVGVKRKCGVPSGEVGHSHSKRKTSFEMFLSTLPKCDPVVRTEGWLYQQPVEWTKDPVFNTLTSLPQRGHIVPLPQPPMTRASTVGYETSVSYCESARGTHGRGTPPPLDLGQPRLDDLFRQLHVKQEHQARKEMGRQGEMHLSSRNLRDIESVQVLGYPPGVTPELLPFLSSTGYYRAEPPSILHKNSFYYNQAARQDTFTQDTHCCEWGNCSVRFSSGKELLEHMQKEHISVLPLYHSKYKVHSSRGHQLICRWKDCFEVFDARYKLFLHIQNSHFKQYKTTTTTKMHMEDEYCPPQEHKYATHPIRKPPTTKCYPTQERSSLHVISIPFPDVSSRQTMQHSKKRRESHYRSILHPLQPDRTQNHGNYKPSGR